MLPMSFIRNLKSNSHYYHYGEVIDRPYDKIVFRDLPNTMVEIEQT